jgi:hypothetical protein
MGIDFLAASGKKLLIVAAILSLLTGVRYAMDLALAELQVTPPAAMLDIVSMLLPANFGTFLDYWLLFFAVAGGVRIARYVSSLNA